MSSIAELSHETMLKQGIESLLRKKLSPSIVDTLIAHLLSHKGFDISKYADHEVRNMANTVSNGNYRLELDIGRGLMRLQDGLSTWSSTVSDCESLHDEDVSHDGGVQQTPENERVSPKELSFFESRGADEGLSGDSGKDDNVEDPHVHDLILHSSSNVPSAASDCESLHDQSVSHDDGVQQAPENAGMSPEELSFFKSRGADEDLSGDSSEDDNADEPHVHDLILNSLRHVPGAASISRVRESPPPLFMMNTCGSLSYVRCMLNAGAIPKMIKLLESGDLSDSLVGPSQPMESAAQCLMNIAMHFPEEVIDAGAVPLLLKCMLKKTSRQVYASALWNLAVNNIETQKVIAGAGGIPIMDELLFQQSDDDW